MIRQMVHIDEERCNGCGLCAAACHEGAIAMVDGKAKLIKDDYCDGMGDCLPGCPTGALTIEMREAAPYDEAAVMARKKEKSRLLTVNPEPSSQLINWPVQIKLAPLVAPYFHKADLLIAATCSAYAYERFHQDFIRGRVTLVGCPKLDGVDYGEKLTEIFRNNDLASITVVRMEVPCCNGLAAAVKRAIEACGKDIPLDTIILSSKGEILRGKEGALYEIASPVR